MLSSPLVHSFADAAAFPGALGEAVGMAHLPAFSDELLDRDDEVRLARQIEAGVLARERLSSAPAELSGDLTTLVRMGAQAWDRFWRANLRLAMRIAGAEARRARASLDDVFQEACLGLAEAIMRFDYTRGVRFSTFAYPWIRHRAYLASLTRGGRRDLPLSRQRALRRIGVADSACDVIPVSPATLESLARGVEPDALAGEPPWWFLHISDRERAILELRYGLGSVPHTQEQTARRLGLSLGQVRRGEQAALARVRELLKGDRAA
ncbi:MAG: sigma-70 family RNA polymerase sigma factor [Propionibacteriaceae bacterium]|nr:sigma-70 family RNA polymerase sigma factor [Propionibacteriaceae bacterium]